MENHLGLNKQIVTGCQKDGKGNINECPAFKDKSFKVGMCAEYDEGGERCMNQNVQDAVMSRDTGNSDKAETQTGEGNALNLKKIAEDQQKAKTGNENWKRPGL